jgi:squalene-associated FAD-dependent desaturase
MTQDRGSVLVIGGGLAGLAAATALAQRGRHVHLIESRNRLGGRATSFIDSVTGQEIDNCQHVSMGCCTELAHFCRTLGIDRHFEAQPCLYFMTSDGKISKLEADPLPAPFHLTRSFLAAHYLGFSEKLRVLWGLANLQLRTPVDDPPFVDWLRAHRQTQRTVDRFWGVVLTSALNETIDRIGLRPARKVFVDGFLRGRHSWEVMIPRVPLGRLYGDEMLHWFQKHDIRVDFNTAVKQLEIAGGKITAAVLRSGETLTADSYVSAVPFTRLLELLPLEVTEQHEYFSNLRKLETSPITSVHLWYDRPCFSLQHVVLLGCLGQWVFNRGEPSSGEHYLQVVLSASRALRGLGHDEIQRRIHEELSKLFPAIESAKLLRGRVITEHAATFSAVPGVDRWRPSQRSPIERLFVAGDWTDTGWPATMESAVRSGYLAADAVMNP